MAIIFYANLNKLSAKHLEKLVTKIIQTNHDILIFTETNFKDNIAPDPYKNLTTYFNDKLVEYTIFRADHPMKFGRGIAIFIKKKNSKV